MKFTRRTILATVAMMPLMAQAAMADGLISIIVNDPSNPYWYTEGEVAKATAEELGYDANVSAHKGDTNTESNLVDTAITNKAKAIILDPANADGSVGAVKKAVEAGIPVFIVNAEINQSGLAKAQLVSNNAQGAALGAMKWVEAMGEKGSYVELFGAPSDNNAQTRSNGFETVLSQYPDLDKKAQEVANWDRTQGYSKMQSMLQANPDITGVIATGTYTIFTAGELRSPNAYYVFNGENAFADFTAPATFERFRVQFSEIPQGLRMVVNPFGPGPVAYDCILRSSEAL